MTKEIPKIAKKEKKVSAAAMQCDTLSTKTFAF